MILLISTCKYKLSENEFVKPIKNIVEQCGEKTLIRNIKNIGDLSKVKKIIICGTALNDNDFINYNLLKSFKKPVLGICAGMQLIAKHFGNEIYKQTEIGMKKVKFTNGKIIEAYELHNFAVNPNGFQILAKSKDCPQMIQRENYIGVLFHPEVRNEWLIQDFLKGKIF